MANFWMVGDETVRRVADVLRGRRALLLKLELLLGSGLKQVCDEKPVWRRRLNGLYKFGEASCKLSILVNSVLAS